MKKILYVLLCVLTGGAPLTIKILKKSWAKPVDIYETKSRQLSVSEKMFIYTYSSLGPVGLLFALMSR